MGMEELLDHLTPEQRKLHEEFVNCHNIQRAEELANMLNESMNGIPYYDITSDEFIKKYGLVPHEELWGKIMDKMVNCESWTPQQWWDYYSKDGIWTREEFCAELDKIIERVYERENK